MHGATIKMVTYTSSLAEFM